MPFDDDDVLIEVTRLGAWCRVAALHVGSGRETVVHGVCGTSVPKLVETAVRRLTASRKRHAAPRGDGLFV